MEISRNFYNTKTDETISLLCKYDDIGEILEELGEEWVRGAVDTVNYTTAGTKDIYASSSNGWRSVLNKVKKGSGRKNTIPSTLGEI